jgi:DNA-binding transcriptional ArsR family regulator
MTGFRHMPEPAMPTIARELADLAALIADPGRALILSRLMDGRSQTAGELALVAGVTPQTASWHLGKLVERALLKVERRGRAGCTGWRRRWSPRSWKG